MTNKELWLKVAQFKIDDPNAEVKFSNKLQKEEEWTDSFTLRAISEYKKFLYLCLSQPNGAAPPPIIDKVWHLHLTYTDNYWNQFCKKTIGIELHHNPSKGGESENYKHYNWTKDTLIAYVKEFQELPPTDIWYIPYEMNLEQYLPPNSPFYTQRIVLDNPFKSKIVQQFLIFSSIILLILLSIFKNPFSLNGIEFLIFYTGLALISIASSYTIRIWHQEIIRDLIPRLHPLKISSIFGGADIAAQAMAADAHQKGYISLEKVDFVVNDRNQTEPIYAGLLTVDSWITPKMLFLYFKAYAKQFLDESKENMEELKDKKIVFDIIHWIILFIGAARIAQGISNNQPIFYLIIVLILLNSIKPIISKVKLNQIDDYEDLYRQNDSNYNFSMASVGFIFTQFYLFDEQKGTAWAFDAYTDKKFHKEDSAGGGCGSGTCGSGADGGSSCGSDGGGCGGCGGCGGGD